MILIALFALVPLSAFGMNNNLDDCFANQHYQQCTCDSPTHRPDSDLKQYISYTTIEGKYIIDDGTLTKHKPQETSFRAELVPPCIKPEKNDIYFIRKNGNRPGILTDHYVATINDPLTKKDNVSLLITNYKNEIVWVAIMGWDNKDLKVLSDGSTAYEKQTHQIHFVATSTHGPLPTDNNPKTSKCSLL